MRSNAIDNLAFNSAYTHYGMVSLEQHSGIMEVEGMWIHKSNNSVFGHMWYYHKSIKGGALNLMILFLIIVSLDG